MYSRAFAVAPHSPYRRASRTWCAVAWRLMVRIRGHVRSAACAQWGWPHNPPELPVRRGAINGRAGNSTWTDPSRDAAACLEALRDREAAARLSLGDAFGLAHYHELCRVGLATKAECWRLWTRREQQRGVLAPDDAMAREAIQTREEYKRIEPTGWTTDASMIRGPSTVNPQRPTRRLPGRGGGGPPGRTRGPIHRDSGGPGSAPGP